MAVLEKPLGEIADTTASGKVFEGCVAPISGIVCEWNRPKNN